MYVRAVLLYTASRQCAFQVILVSYQTLMADFPTKLDKSDQSSWLPEMGCVNCWLL